MEQDREYTALLTKAMAYCASCERCTLEIKQKLKDWGAESRHIHPILEALAEGFYDDARFARAYIRDKFRFNKWGRYKIQYQLRGKGISDEMSDPILDEECQDEYKEIIQSALELKLKTLASSAPEQRKAKLIRFAASRGYDMDIVYQLVNQLLNMSEL